MIERAVARVLLFDKSNRLLLLFDPDPERGAYWYPPGGRIERGESPQEAARREVAEELGADIEAGQLVLRRRAQFTYGDRQFDQKEWHFAARIDEPVVPVSRSGDNEAGAVAAHRWWSLSELRTSTDRMFPEGLADAVERFLADESPSLRARRRRGARTPLSPIGADLCQCMGQLDAFSACNPQSASHQRNDRTLVRVCRT